MYMFATGAVAVFYLVALFDNVSRAMGEVGAGHSDGSGKRRSLRLVIATSYAALAGAAVVLLPLIQTVAFSMRGQKEQLIGTSLPADVMVGLSVMGGLCCLVWGAVRYGLPWLRSNFAVSCRGIAFVGYSAASLIVITAGTLHLNLAATGSAMVTSAAVEFSELSDVHCKAGVFVAEWGEDRKVDAEGSAVRPVRYRCPTGPVFFSWSETPFVPWPDYSTGESTKLARFLSDSQQIIDDSESRN